MERKDVIKDNKTGKLYFDNGMIRNFETLIDSDLTYEQALEKYPDIIKI